MQPFNFNANFTNVTAASGGAQGPLPTGYYKVVIADCYAKVASTGRQQAEFKIKIAEGDWSGVPRTTRINIPTGPGDKVLAYWRALLESVGVNPQQLDSAGNVSITPDMFKGRSAYIHYTQGDRDAGVWDKTNFIAPGTYTAGVAADAAADSVMGASSGGMAALPTAATGNGGLNVPSPASTPAMPFQGQGNGAGQQTAMTSDSLMNALLNPNA